MINLKTMPRSVAMKLLQLQIRNPNNRKHRVIRTPFDVFISYRGKDTRRTVASLLFDHLYRLNFRPFLDDKSMKPGDKLFDKIDNAINGCKIGVALFSPRYCESYFCLHELALILESKKKMIPIFCNVKPSELHVLNNGRIPLEEVERFNLALEEAKCTVGLTFDSYKEQDECLIIYLAHNSNLCKHEILIAKKNLIAWNSLPLWNVRNWADVVTNAANIVVKSLIEVEDEEEQMLHHNPQIAF